jgi:hypothetical protein
MAASFSPVQSNGPAIEGFKPAADDLEVQQD